MRRLDAFSLFLISLTMARKSSRRLSRWARRPTEVLTTMPLQARRRWGSRSRRGEFTAEKKTGRGIRFRAPFVDVRLKLIAFAASRRWIRGAAVYWFRKDKAPEFGSKKR